MLPEKRPNRLRLLHPRFQITCRRKGLQPGNHSLKTSAIGDAHTRIHIIRRKQFVDKVDIAAAKTSLMNLRTMALFPSMVISKILLYRKIDEQSI